MNNNAENYRLVNEALEKRSGYNRDLQTIIKLAVSMNMTKCKAVSPFMAKASKVCKEAGFTEVQKICITLQSNHNYRKNKTKFWKLADTLS